MIHETLDIKTEPLLTPEAVYGKHEKICDVCVITFSYKVIEWALQHLKCEQAAEIGCCNGNRFLFASDCLESEEWHNEMLGSEREWDTQVKCFLLALDLCESTEGRI